MRYQRWWDHWLCTTPVGSHSRGSHAQQLLWRSFWCRHFAMINAAGLRKILKCVSVDVGHHMQSDMLETRLAMSYTSSEAFAPRSAFAQEIR